MDPRLLDGVEGMTDFETGKDLTGEYLRQQVETYWPFIAVFREIDAGVVRMTLNEYAMLPVTFVVCWNLWKAEMKREKGN